MTALWVGLGFLVGVAVGRMWGEAVDLLTGKDDPVHLWTRTRNTFRRVRDDRTTLLVAGLILSMLFTGIVGIRVALSDGARGDLVRCVTDYNAAVGAARDSRSKVADELAEAETNYVDEELRYQRGLLESLSTDDGVERLRDVISDRVAATEMYRQALDRQTRVREAEPYPAPDLCAERR